ncbi:hypothetical protein FRZ03_09975 [Streptomyces misionensis]|uniref:Uncharacterized protein n=1 Tax=Streptomyces misionensis TaxID=67331 RepID=A0A5C6JVV9_9ACTN|nr:hypothetical protein [Streptomyces misionensis]TWV53465.1 hypothetical protein FRZ03_09975 [Streptomyces misionensis]
MTRRRSPTVPGQCAGLAAGPREVAEAAQAAATLGATAAGLLPALRAAVTDPDVADLGQLAEAALHSAETGADVSGACEALQALGATALSTHQRLRVAELAEQDRRIVDSGVANNIIREDERLRAILTAI